MAHARSAVLAVLLVLAGCAGGRAAAPPPAPVPELPKATASANPFGDAPFTGDPAEIVDLMARLAPSDEDVEVLLEDVRYEFDAKGTRTARFRRVFRILTPAGVKGWASFSVGWSPSRESRPVVKARVIGPDGTVTPLDPATIGDGPAGSGDPEMFGDRRVVRAPLPALVPGAVVEEVAVTADTRPFFEGMASGRYALGDRVPVLRTRIVVDAPTSLGLRWRIAGAKAEPAVRRADGRETLTFEIGPMTPIPDLEPFVASEIVQWPRLEWTTAPSWQAVAEGYAKIVDAKIAEGAVDDLAREIAAKSHGETDRIRRLMAEVARLVRYTGVEFGAGATVPRSPKETLVRHYGDCKDKATLLVNLLRATGTEAYVALLETGPGPDVDPELPGLSNFDHAIVYVPGRKERFIDPTDAGAPLGVLPAQDRGRLALVARPGTRTLERIPDIDPAANLAVKSVDLDLAERGPGRMTLTFRFDGAIASDMRDRVSTNSPGDVEDFYAGQAKDSYLAKKVDAVKIGDPAVVDRPFEIQVKASKVERTYSDGGEGGAALQLVSVYEWLPDLLTENLEEDVLEDRRHDLVLPEPHVSEVRYRIALPPRWTVRTVPEGSEAHFGPATLTKRYAVEDGALTAVWRFDTGDGRLTVDEARALRAQMEKDVDAEPLMVAFDLEPAKAAAAGHLEEAVAGYRALVALHPKEPLHHAQLARILLKAGFGEAARAEARAAVALDPKDAYAQDTLGWALQHDLYGRLRHPGFDREGALKAYREAVRLDPEELTSAADLAILLEYDAAGRRYASKDLEESVRTYRDIKDRLKADQLNLNLLIALYRAGHYEEAAEMADGMKQDTARAIGLAATAVTKGVEAARARATGLGLSPAARTQALFSATLQLVNARRYDAARAMADALPADRGGSRVMDLRSLLAKAAPIEALDADDGPGGPVRRAFAAAMSRSAAERQAGVRRELSRTLDDETAERVMGELAFGDQVVERLDGRIDPGAFREVMGGALKVHVEGEAGEGRRVRMSADFAKGKGPIAYVVREDGAWRLLTLAATPGPVGRRALALLERGDTETAYQWLDWVREDVGTVRSEDPLGGPPFAGLWGGTVPRTPEAARRAAAALTVSGSGAEAAVRILSDALGELEGEQATLVRVALVNGLSRLDRAEDALPVIAALREAHPRSDQAFVMQVSALLSLDRYEAVQAACEARLEEVPSDVYALFMRSVVSLHEGRVDEAEATLKRTVETGSAGATIYNQLAWVALFTKTPLEKALTWARRAVAMDRGDDPAHLHTLAVVYAELGRDADARDAFLRLIDARDDGAPRDADWYVVGRLAERYGLDDAAVAAYRKVPRPDEAGPVDTWRLVEKRLKALGERP